MEGLLGILVGIAVLLSTMTNLFKKFADDEGKPAGRDREWSEGQAADPGDGDREKTYRKAADRKGTFSSGMDRQEIERRIEEGFRGFFPAKGRQNNTLEGEREQAETAAAANKAGATGGTGVEADLITAAAAPAAGESQSARTAGRDRSGGPGRSYRGTQGAAAGRRKKRKVSPCLPAEQELIRGREDLIRGIIFKEILDPPRARRPYRPPSRR